MGGNPATLRGVSDNHAGEEVERTLALERDQVERRIALVRVWFFGIITISGPLMYLVQRRQGAPIIWTPTFFYLGWVVYAIVLRRVVLRVGARDWLIYLSLLL